MITIHGISKSEGIAIAAASIVNGAGASFEIPPSLVMKGIEALKSGLQPNDYPEAVIVCDSVSTGLAMRISGVRNIGIAAESEADAPGMECNIPCVIGVPELMSAVSDGDIVIVDGHKGLVHIDPDPATLVHYQEIEDRAASREKVFISSEHIPARTQNGDTVFVYAYATTESEILRGLDEGADGILADLRANQTDEQLYSKIMMASAGKPLAFAVDNVDGALLRAAMRFSLPNQITLLFPHDKVNDAVTDMMTEMMAVYDDAYELDLDPPVVRHGAIGEITVLGNRVEEITSVVESGKREVAVSPEMVKAAKFAIRSIGSEDNANRRFQADDRTARRVPE